MWALQHTESAPTDIYTCPNTHMHARTHRPGDLIGLCMRSVLISSQFKQIISLPHCACLTLAITMNILYSVSLSKKTFFSLCISLRQNSSEKKSCSCEIVFCPISIDSLPAEQDEKRFQIFCHISEKQQRDSPGVIYEQDIHLHETAVTEKKDYLIHLFSCLFRSCGKWQQERMRCTRFTVDSAGNLMRLLFNSKELLSGSSAARA